MTILLAALAVFFVWETVLAVSPWTIPALLQSGLVYGGALAYLWPDWRTALATCGVVMVMHILLVSREAAAKATPKLIRRPSRTTNVPDLP